MPISIDATFQYYFNGRGKIESDSGRAVYKVHDATECIEDHTENLPVCLYPLFIHPQSLCLYQKEDKGGSFSVGWPAKWQQHPVNRIYNFSDSSSERISMTVSEINGVFKESTSPKPRATDRVQWNTKFPYWLLRNCSIYSPK